MAVTAERLRVEVEADVDDATRDLGKLGDEGSKIPGWAKAAGAALAGAFAVDKIISGVKAAVTAASDLQQSVGGVEAVFGQNAATVNAWSQGAAKALGLSANSYNEFATIVGSQLKNMGMPMEEVTGKTNDLIAKGADLAATFGGSTSDAVSALSSLLRGETDPIEAYGVSIKQADIAAKMAEMGLSGLSGEAQKAGQTQALLALLTDQTAAAQGSFARESDTLAGSQQRLGASWTNVTAILGGAFLPAATQVTQWAQVAVDWFGNALPGALATISAAWGALSALLFQGDFTSQFREVFNVGEDSGLVDFLFTLRETVISVFGTIKDVAGASIGAFVAAIGPGLSQAAAGFGPLLSMLPQVVSLFNPLGMVIQALLPILPQLAGMLGTLAGTLVSALMPVLTALVPVLTSVAQTIIGALSQAFVALMPSVMALMPIITSLASTLGGVLLTVVQALTPLIMMLADVFAQILPAVVAIIEPVLSIVQALLPLVGVVGQLIGALLPPLVDLFMALLGPILDLIAPLVGALVPVLNSVANLISTYLVPYLTNLATMFGKVVAAVAPVITALVGGLVGAISSVIQWVVKVAAAIATWVLDSVAAIGRFAVAVGDKIGEAVQWFKDLPGNIMDAISGLAGRMKESGIKIVQGLIDGIKGMIGKVKDAASNVVGAIRDFLPFSPAKTGPFSGRGWTLYSGRSITTALADGMLDNVRDVQRAGLAVASAAALNLPGASLGAPTALAGRGGPSSNQNAPTPADALGVGSANGYGSATFVIVDADGTLRGMMRGEAGKVATGKVTPLDEGLPSW